MQLPPAQQRFTIEAPPAKGNMCVFHLIDEHDGNSYLEMVRYAQLVNFKDTSNEWEGEESSKQPGDSEIHFLEYKSDSERGGDILVTLEDPSCAVLTRNQQNVKPQGASSSSSAAFKSKGLDPNFSINDQKLQEPSFFKPVVKDSSFDIIESCKSSQIQITPA